MCCDWHLEVAFAGNADGEFRKPRGIEVDSSGNFYVSDYGNHRIQKFDPSGRFLAKWGSYGGGEGQFRSPMGITVDSAGNVFVADPDNHRIQKFDPSGKFLAKWGKHGTGDGEFRLPVDVAVAPSGCVYVVDFANQRIQEFDPSGTCLGKWGSEGSGDGEFQGPRAVAVDSHGNVFVADSDNNRIQKFDPSGKLLAKWGSEGCRPRQFRLPTGVAVDLLGNVYVLDSENHRIQKFRPDFDIEGPTLVVAEKPYPLEDQPEVLAFDGFDGKLNLDWQILRPDPSHYSLSKNPGSLTITTQEGGFVDANVDYENLFLMDSSTAPSGDFQLTTSISSFKPAGPWNQAGLICYNDDDNYLKWNCDKRANDEPCLFGLGHETRGAFKIVHSNAPEGLDGFWLRVTKQGNV